MLQIWRDGQKWACRSCITGHRSSRCTHEDRELHPIARKGRPSSQSKLAQEEAKAREMNNGQQSCSGGSSASSRAGSPGSSAASSEAACRIAAAKRPAFRILTYKSDEAGRVKRRRESSPETNATLSSTVQSRIPPPPALAQQSQPQLQQSPMIDSNSNNYYDRYSMYRQPPPLMAAYEDSGWRSSAVSLDYATSSSCSSSTCPSPASIGDFAAQQAEPPVLLHTNNSSSEYPYYSQEMTTSPSYQFPATSYSYPTFTLPPPSSLSLNGSTVRSPTKFDSWHFQQEYPLSIRGDSDVTPLASIPTSNAGVGDLQPSYFPQQSASYMPPPLQSYLPPPIPSQSQSRYYPQQQQQQQEQFPRVKQEPQEDVYGSAWQPDTVPMSRPPSVDPSYHHPRAAMQQHVPAVKSEPQDVQLSPWQPSTASMSRPPSMDFSAYNHGSPLFATSERGWHDTGRADVPAWSAQQNRLVFPNQSMA